MMRVRCGRAAEWRNRVKTTGAASLCAVHENTAEANSKQETQILSVHEKKKNNTPGPPVDGEQ